MYRYGQTGSGKTYTMEGGEAGGDASRGMIPRAVEQIFSAMHSDAYAEWGYTLKASFLEVCVLVCVCVCVLFPAGHVPSFLYAHGV